MQMGRHFDHETVYQNQLQFISWLSELFHELREAKFSRLTETLAQLERSSLSVFDAK
jgi:NAD-dependent SIR2 family protein deacetylase